MSSTILLDQSVSHRRAPQNLCDEDMHLFSHEFERKIPPATLRVFQDVRVLDTGEFFSGLRLLETGDPGGRSTCKSRFRSYRRLIRSHQAMITIPSALWISDRWSSSYFHWLCDALPRLWVAKSRLGSIPLLLPSRFENVGYIRDALNILNIANVEFVPRRGSVYVDKLLFPSDIAPTGNYHDALMRELGNEMRSRYSFSAKRHRRIYISRGKSQRRHVSNEFELLPILTRHGFEIIYMETLSFAEQVVLLAETDFLISNHGAGLTNMMFMPPGGRVLEMRHSNDRRNNCYFALTSALSLEYFYVLGQPVNPQEDTVTANITVDVVKLEVAITQLTSS